MFEEKNVSISIQEKEEALRSLKARQIVQEILRYGATSDLQILKIIKFLALELENTETMKSICRAIDSDDDQNNHALGGSRSTEKTNKIEL